MTLKNLIYGIIIKFFFSRDISDQRNAQNLPALLLSYPDFLSFSFVKRV